MRTLLFLILTAFLTIRSQAQDLRLWYSKPAVKWTEALPVGNGRIGAMIFGGTDSERIQFNEESLWTGEPRNYNRKGAHNYLGEIRTLLQQGKQTEADALAEKHFMGMQSNEGDRKGWMDKMYAIQEPAAFSFDDHLWKSIRVPSFDGWESVGLEGLDGAVWLRKEFNWDPQKSSEHLVVELNRIRDADRTFLNGKLIGARWDNENRTYAIPASLLQPGKNILAVQVLNFGDKGGITGFKDTSRHIGIRSAAATELFVDLQGQWKYWIQQDNPPPVPHYQADYQPFGDLRFVFGHQNVTQYHRELDLRNAIQKTRYLYDGVRYERDVFVSAVDQTMVVDISANTSAMLSFTVWMDALHKGTTFRKVDDSTYALQVHVRNGALVGESFLRIRQKGGSRFFSDGKLTITKADKVEIFLTAATNFKRFDDVSGRPDQICMNQLARIAKQSVAQIKSKHLAEYKKIFDRFAIHFGYSPQDAKPTDQRIDEFATTYDPSLLALYTQYGRYLLISSSRPGTMPANLQGIWNDQISPPWGSKYTTNINAEMNYWPAELLNLSDHHEPLFKMIQELAERGSETAKEYYGARGWVLHHNTDLWRGTAPINAANHGIWQTGGAWLSHHLWEHFLYTQDTAFLQHYYPILKGAAVFFLDAMIRDPKTGWYISSPSNSPEQGGLVEGPSMDHQIIRSLFKVVIAAGAILKSDSILLDSMKTRLAAIAPDQIGKYGQLQEWMNDVDDPSNRHRHVSHLWGVFPGTEISWDKNPLFMNAAKQSLLFRRDAATGWSLGWKINLWARFKDGDHVYRLLQMLLSPAEKFGAGSYPNLFDAHPPFQIDGNFGGSAGIVEMLVQSHDGKIDLLPALPTVLKDGMIKGVKLRGGIELEMQWKEGGMTNVVLHSAKGGRYTIQYGTIVRVVKLKPAERIRLNKSLEPILLDISETKLDQLSSPWGIQHHRPIFSWKIESDKTNVFQSAYQIVVYNKSTTQTYWDAGKKISSRSIGVPYGGNALEPNTTYYWKVRIWDNHHEISSWSALDSFHTGLFSKDDWQHAKWISMQRPDSAIQIFPMEHGKGKIKKSGDAPILPIFRKTFQIGKTIKEANLHITGLGQFDCFINGQKVGDHFLDPGWTAFDKEVLYQTFNVTDVIQAGENVMGVMLGNGMYHVPAQRYRKFTGSFGYPKMICYLSVLYTDGSMDKIISDRSWRCTSSPITFSSIYGGEDMDGRKWQKGWLDKGFLEVDWKPSVEIEHNASLIHQFFPPIKFMDSFDVRTSKALDAVTTIYDMGQNASGIPSIVVKGHAGDTIRIWPGELVLENGKANQKATGGPSYFQYILSGDGIEKWRPQFSYTGFRYLQVDRLPINKKDSITILDLKAIHTYAAVDRIGSFQSSNALFNATEELINWAIQSNTQSVSTDCPHREKIGWLEQVHLMSNAIRQSYSISLHLQKTLLDIRSAVTAEGAVPTFAPEYVFMRTPGDPFGESPEWGSTAILTPWDMYQWYGDVNVLKENYAYMKKHIAYLTSREQDGLLYFGLGDWYDLGPNKPGFSQLTPKGLTASALYYQDLKTMEQVAKVLGEILDAQHYAQKALLVQKQFHRTFYNATTGNYGTGSQTANAMSLVTGVAQLNEREGLIRNLVDSLIQNDCKITAGDIGFRYLIAALTDAGRSDILYKMNNRSDVPGYGYQLARGATALTESWQALPSASNNHLMLGHIKEWFYTGLAGIKKAEVQNDIPVFDLSPQYLKELHHVSVSQQTLAGHLNVSWHWEDEKILLDVIVPVNTKIVLHNPDHTTKELGSGQYSFTYNNLL